MLYIFIILLVLLVLVAHKIRMGGSPSHDFNLQETLPLRGFLAICVMLTHLCPYLVDEAPLLDNFGLWGPPSVATFFLLAGYGLAFSYRKKGDAYLHGFFKKRLLRLLWPLLIMTIIYQGYKVYQSDFDLKEMLANPSPMSWFIYALVIWYVGYYVAFKIGGARKNRLVLIWLFTILYLVVTIKLNLAYYYASILPLPLALTYVFYEDKVKDYLIGHNEKVWYAAMVITLIVMGYSVAGQYGVKLPGWGLPINTLLPVMMIYVTYYLGGWKSAFTNFLGHISYEFYIVHGFIVMQLGRCHLFGLTGYINAFLVIALTFGLTVFFAWLLSCLCAKINLLLN